MPSVLSLKDHLRPLVTRVRNRRNAALYGGCAVLLYHRVTTLDTDPQLLAVTPEAFDAHLSVLKKHYRVLTIEEFDHYLLGSKRFPKNAVLLTFDDGYADNHHAARPILERHGLQALFYIASGYMGQLREYWWDEVERMILLNPELPLEFSFERPGSALHWNGGMQPGGSERDGHYRRSLEILRPLPSEERDSILDELRMMLRSEEPRASHLPMSIDELRAFATSKAVVIGAHTVGHPSLAGTSKASQRAEIEGSRSALEGWLGRSVPYFSYPFGTGADFNATTEELVQAAGFKHVAANFPGLVHARSPRFKFPRFLVRNWEAPEFQDRLQGFFNA